GMAIAAVSRPSEEELVLELVTRTAQKSFQVLRKVPSMLQPAAEYYLSIRAGGELEEILVKPGELVTKGQTVGVVDKAKRVADLERAFSNFDLARTDMQRIRRLFNQGAATRQEWD